MNLLHLFRVETLDTRFHPPSPTPLPSAKASRWRTPEFYFYYLCFLTIPFLMVKAVYECSIPSHPAFWWYRGLLSPGWIPGREVDNSDAQYASFRNNIPYLAVLVVLQPSLRKGYEWWTARARPTESGVINAADARLKSRVTFDISFAAVFCIALHGVSAPKVFLILWLNYQVATLVPKRYVGMATWVFNIGILFANELSRGYRFANLAAFLLPSQTTAAGKESLPNWGTRMDGYGGLIPRWEILFNITVLRLISFNFDYLWSLDRRAGSPIEKKNLDPAALSERDRINFGAQPHDYTFANYLAYTLYAPLYLAGPILTFNDFITQARHPLPSTTPRTRLIPYAIRFLFCLLVMELCLHYLYAVAILEATSDWSVYTPFQLSMLAYFNLHIIWLKLLLPWRFFRLWALLDAIDPPENMVRCVSDTYSTLAFWRSWHRSFNRWILRYIYIPLGGSQRGGVPTSKPRAVLNYLAVFTFVALWHDISLRLLIWGWLVVLFILPELLARALFPAKAFVRYPNLYRWLCGTGGVANLMFMMIASLVGFAIGLDGLKGLVDGIVGSVGGRLFLVSALGTVFVGVMIMFEWREGERRRGLEMKC